MLLNIMVKSSTPSQLSEFKAGVIAAGIRWVSTVLGIDDPWIWGVYLLCILSTLLCIAYGLINWNKGAELEAEEAAEELAWEAKEEKKLEA